MAHKLADFPEVKQGTYQEAVNILHITEPQDICIGFHCYSPKNQNWITIDDVSLVKVEDTAADLSVDGISNPVGVVRAEADGRVEFSVSNNGITDMVGRIAATVDGVAVKDTTVSLAANQQKTITMAGVTETLVAGNHRLEVSVAADGDADASNNAATLDFVVLGKPVMLWDFESGSLPSDLRMRVEDGGTVSPDAGSEAGACSTLPRTSITASMCSRSPRGSRAPTGPTAGSCCPLSTWPAMALTLFGRPVLTTRLTPKAMR